jgi:uncharacterized protein (TIGR03546 family)
MIGSLLRPVRRTIEAIVAHNSPRELAAGFALGMVLGLVPKGNLIAVSLLVLLFSLRVNAGMGLVAAVLFSWLGGALDPFANKLGVFVLSIGSLQATFATVLNLPLGPWIGFNNTVVAGALLVGLYFAYPVYWLGTVAFSRLRPPAAPEADNLARAPRIFDESTERRAA